MDPTLLVVGVVAFLVGLVAGWLMWRVLHPPAPEPVLVAERPQDSPLLARARILTADADRANASGEYKRHQVYARLLKEFPGERKRDVAMAIERAVSEGL